MAFMEAEERERVIREKGLARYTDNTITAKRALIQELNRIKEQGYAMSNAGHDELIRAVACPVRDHTGAVIASVSALGVITRMTAERALQIADPVKKAAAEISQQLGYPSKH